MKVKQSWKKKKKFLDCLAPEEEGTTNFEMAKTSHPMAQSHIVEDLHPHQYYYENLRSHKSDLGCQ